MIRNFLASAVAFLALAFAPLALAQSSPGFVAGQVPTASQWNSYFAGKQNYSANMLLGPGSGSVTPGNMACWAGYPSLADCGAPVTLVAGAGISITGGPAYTVTASGSSVSPANPTASLGLSAINGAASTYMRSDAAPALSQAIVPTWTGIHTFSASPVFNGAGTPTFATPENWRTALAVGGLATTNTWAAAQTFSAPVSAPAGRSAKATITLATATFTPNFDTAADFEIGLTSACPCTLANPSTTPVAGQKGVIYVTQDATGSRTIGTYGSFYKIPTAGWTLTTTASRTDALSYVVRSATQIVLTMGAVNVPQ